MTVILCNQLKILHLRRHLHLELCKISREIDSIFGMGITLSIGCYFCWLTQGFYEILNQIFIKNYMKDGILHIALILIWCFYFIFKLLFINYVCEVVSTKVLFYSNSKLFILDLLLTIINYIFYITKLKTILIQFYT